MKTGSIQPPRSHLPPSGVHANESPPSLLSPPKGEQEGVCVCSSRKRRARLEFKRRSLKNAREIRTGFKQLPVERDFYFDLYFYNDEDRGGEKERRIRGGLKQATCVTATMLFSDGV